MMLLGLSHGSEVNHGIAGSSVSTTATSLIKRSTQQLTETQISQISDVYVSRFESPRPKLRLKLFSLEC